MNHIKKYLEKRREWLDNLSDQATQDEFVDLAEDLLDEPNTLYPLTRIMMHDALISSNNESFIDKLKRTQKTKLILPSTAVAKMLDEIAETRLTHYNFHASISNMLILSPPPQVDVGGTRRSVERALNYISRATERYSGGQSYPQSAWNWIYEVDALRLVKIFLSEIPKEELFAEIGDPFGISSDYSSVVNQQIFGQWEALANGPTTHLMWFQRHFIMVYIDPSNKTVQLVEGLDRSYLKGAKAFMEKYMPDWKYAISSTGVQKKVDNTPKSCGIFAAIFSVIYAMTQDVEEIASIKYDWEHLVGQLHLIVQSRKSRIPKGGAYFEDSSGTILID